MKSDFSHIDYKKAPYQVYMAGQVLLNTPGFIKKHQLWKGFLDHKWILIMTMVIMGTLSVTLYNDIDTYINAPNVADIEIPAEGFDTKIEALSAAALTSSEEEIESLEAEKKSLIERKEKLEAAHKPLFSGSYKFLLLILLEVLIFHFAVGTNNIIKDQNRILTVKEFARAQIRMIKVMVHKWIFGLLMYIGVSVVCGILKISYLTNLIMFFVYGFFLGFALLDNYLEQYHFTIPRSSKQIQTHFGAATTFGIFASIGMSIPVIGPILIPFIGAVAATLYGHQMGMEKEVTIV